MDLDQEIRGFKPIDLEKYSQNNEATDTVVKSVELYNKAVEYLKSGNEDIAMIELKKVVSVNPNFYEAVNLLGLCYAYTNQPEKAEELFGSIVQKENNAIKAADYLNFISISENGSYKKAGRLKQTANDLGSNKSLKELSKKSTANEKNVLAENLVLEKIKSGFTKPYIVMIINVVSIICLIAAIILFAASRRDAGKVDTGSEPAVSAQNQSEAGKTSAELEKIKDQLAAANGKLKQYELSEQVSNVSALYAQKKYIEAADKLLALKADEFTGDLKTQYDSIRKKVLLNAASQLTADGNTLYKSKKYPEAVKKLEKVFTLGDNWEFADKALYILGKSYVEVNDLQKAAAAYQKLIDGYPESSYVKYAKSRLSEIQ
ncbi:tetratricopeptide repeat protein [Ruminiclostridium sufflavum DSM 19573]|uniref:Tetratricopeptide repeat protein n=1 Tax=Ruminiclostridium sufflavum DSM 19573 TaxID=1121337 RepID=A0A318XR54_9FIRM|nr:tetratricopeptide repeat protein [Ruminiclostridium sufflavum]PYG88809.1 tetratricopeptide repeat protein [Ruminiclostridium sufflavum DSM 19573]